MELKVENVMTESNNKRPKYNIEKKGDETLRLLIIEDERLRKKITIRIKLYFVLLLSLVL